MHPMVPFAETHLL